MGVLTGWSAWARLPIGVRIANGDSSENDDQHLGTSPSPFPFPSSPFVRLPVLSSPPKRPLADQLGYVLTVNSVSAGMVAPPGWEAGVVWMNPPAVGVALMSARFLCAAGSACADASEARVATEEKRVRASMLGGGREEGREERGGRWTLRAGMRGGTSPRPGFYSWPSKSIGQSPPDAALVNTDIPCSLPPSAVPGPNKVWSPRATRSAISRGARDRWCTRLA